MHDLILPNCLAPLETLGSRTETRMTLLLAEEYDTSTSRVEIKSLEGFCCVARPVLAGSCCVESILCV